MEKKNLVNDIKMLEQIIKNFKLSDNFSLKEIIDALNKNNLGLLSKKNYDNMYSFLIYIISKRQSEFENLLFNNQDLVKFFIDAEPILYANINFSYDFIKNLIIYLEKNKLSIRIISMLVYMNFRDFTRKEKLLSENISLKSKESIIGILNHEEKIAFLNKTNLKFSNKILYMFLTSGINLNPNLYLTKSFFKDIILSLNFTEIKNNLNYLANFIDISYFLNLKKEFFTTILRSYSKNDDKFHLANFKLALEFVNNYQKKYIDSKDISKKLLINIVINELFQDNVRNVCLNIEEILEFNKIVQVIDIKNLDFYLKIATIFQMENQDIIDLYFSYYKKNVLEFFYDDIRKLKDISYQKIIDLTSNNDISKFKNQELSLKYQTEIYELNGSKFTFLVSCLTDIQDDITPFYRNCYSIISDKNMSVFIENGIIFGYTNILKDHIMHVFENDACSNSMVGGSKYINRIRTPDFLLKSGKMNEIQIINDKLDNGKYQRKKPSFIVCFDLISKKSLKISQLLKIPIVKIDRSKYKLPIKKDLSKSSQQDMYYDLNIYGIKEDSYKNYQL